MALRKCGAAQWRQGRAGGQGHRRGERRPHGLWAPSRGRGGAPSPSLSDEGVDEVVETALHERRESLNGAAPLSTASAVYGAAPSPRNAARQAASSVSRAYTHGSTRREGAACCLERDRCAEQRGGGQGSIIAMASNPFGSRASHADGRSHAAACRSHQPWRRREHAYLCMLCQVCGMCMSRCGSRLILLDLRPVYTAHTHARADRERDTARNDLWTGSQASMTARPPPNPCCRQPPVRAIASL